MSCLGSCVNAISTCEAAFVGPASVAGRGCLHAFGVGGALLWISYSRLLPASLDSVSWCPSQRWDHAHRFMLWSWQFCLNYILPSACLFSCRLLAFSVVFITVFFFLSPGSSFLPYLSGVTLGLGLTAWTLELDCLGSYPGVYECGLSLIWLPHPGWK